MFRRSDFMLARIAFSFVLANFGIAIAARMPMITTTINSSIRVKPLRFILAPEGRGGLCVPPDGAAHAVRQLFIRTSRGDQAVRCRWDRRHDARPVKLC